MIGPILMGERCGNCTFGPNLRQCLRLSSWLRVVSKRDLLQIFSIEEVHFEGTKKERRGGGGKDRKENGIILESVSPRASV